MQHIEKAEKGKVMQTAVKHHFRASAQQIATKL